MKTILNSSSENCQNLKDFKCESDSKTIKEHKLKLCLNSMSADAKFKFWIRTLITSYNTIPEIIKTVDKIIEIQASSVSFMTDVFNKNKSTMSQVESVIDLTERKNSLLNIYIMTKKMMGNLSEDHHDFLEKKFMYNWTSEELATFYNVSIRTIYRKIEKIISIIYEYCLKNNWSLKFIESQTKNEGWLRERYFKLVNEYIKNNNYKQEQCALSQ